MSAASDLEIVEETPAPQAQPGSSNSKRKGRSAAQPAPVEQNAAPSKKAKSTPTNGSTNGTPRVEKAALDALREENEDLKKQLADAFGVVNKFQEDFSQLQNLRLTEPEKALREFIDKADEREKLLQEQNQALLEQLPILEKLLQPHTSGTITLLTRDETDGKLVGYRNEIQNLRAQVESQKQMIDELTQSLRSTQLELDEEIKRSTSLSTQLAERPLASHNISTHGGDVTKSQLKVAFYEDLTSIKIHRTKQFDSEELGLVSELECDCTTYQKTLYFKLQMYKAPKIIDEVPQPNVLVDTIRYIPIGLDQERDQAFLEGLGILADTFTFVKDSNPFDRQMWEFCMEIHRGMTRWRDGEEEEEEDEVEEDDDDAVVVDG